MSHLSNLIARRDAIGVELAALDSTKPGGKPNYSVPHQAVDHNGYITRLYKELEDLEQRISRAEGPWESRSVGYV